MYTYTTSRILDNVWDNAEDLKASFPTDHEAMFITNGTDFIRVSNDEVNTFGKSSVGSSVADDKAVVFATLELKSRNPSAEVYLVHNHPKAEVIVDAGLKDPFTAKSYKQYFDSGHTLEDAYREQRIAGSVPSDGDWQAFYAARNWYNEAIYHQDSNQIVEWQRNAALKTFTKVAVVPHYVYTPTGELHPFYNADPIEDIYLTTEDEAIPGVAYYDFADYRKMAEEHPNIDYLAALNSLH